MRKIGVFGGTFNPIHNGHVLAIREFAEKMQLDSLYVIPAAIPPHKEVPDGSPDAKTRLQMVRSAVKELPYAKVSDLELKREGKSYTSDTLRELKAIHPDDTLYLLVGTDSFLKLDTWHEPEIICELATIVCVHREDDPNDLLSAQRSRLKELYNAQSIILNNRYEEISSSEVRRMLTFRCAQDYIPKPVFQMIERKKLYGLSKDTTRLSFEELKAESLALHNENRVRHVIGCSETAVALAEIYGADRTDAARAGILHDITKALNEEQHLAVLRRYGVELSDYDSSKAKLLHAITGSVIAKHIFGENDAVCDAIRWHTTGKADMNTLEKIIYIADYMEPNRDFPGVAQLRKITYEDLDAAMLLGLTMTTDMLKERGREVDPSSLAALAYFSDKKNGGN
ncbi:MAG: nicotinate (nicotinamide) nucleotide adenylyltransferase [Clostridia bacterium]|nr:nicotinate (nicotinamide) nucleotide adenylyltransferase [Clostridia bacterium]